MRALLVVPLLLAGCIGEGGLFGGGGGPAPPAALQVSCLHALDPCLVRATVENGPANEVTIAVNPADPLHLVAGAKDYTLGEAAECGQYRVWTGVYVSRDGGATWWNGLIPGYPEGPESPLSGFECNSDPVIGFSPDGSVVYYSGLAYGGPGVAPETEAQMQGSAIWVARSTDGGMNWTDISFVAVSDGERVFHDKQWFTVGPDGALHMTWTAFAFGPSVPAPPPVPGVGAAQILYSRSTDGAATWTRPAVLYEFQTQGLTVFAPSVDKQFSTPVVPLNGSVAVTWVVPLPNGTSSVVLAQSSDNGERWSPAKEIFRLTPIPGSLDNTEFRASSYPVAAADPGSGTMAIAYAAWNGADADVVVRTSFDVGSTWSQPVPTGTSTANDQWMPWITFDEAGAVHVAWLDRRHDPGNRLVDAYYAYSPDGTRFIHERRLTPASFDADLGYHQSGGPFIGDYIGIAARAGRAYPFFPVGIPGEASQAFVAPLNVTVPE